MTGEEKSRLILLLFQAYGNKSVEIAELFDQAEEDEDLKQLVRESMLRFLRDNEVNAEDREFLENLIAPFRPKEV